MTARRSDDRGGPSWNRYALAWFVGVCVYMTVMAATVYEGVESLVVQPIIAAVFSAAILLVVSLLSLILLIPPVRRVWRRRVAAAVLIFGFLLVGLCVLYAEIAVRAADPSVAGRFSYLGLEGALTGILLVMFAVANWPAGLRRGATPG